MASLGSKGLFRHHYSKKVATTHSVCSVRWASIGSSKSGPSNADESSKSLGCTESPVVFALRIGTLRYIDFGKMRKIYKRSLQRRKTLMRSLLRIQISNRFLKGLRRKSTHAGYAIGLGRSK